MRLGRADAPPRELKADIHLPNAEVGARAEAIRRVSARCTVHETIAKMGALPIAVHDKTGAVAR